MKKTVLASLLALVATGVFSSSAVAGGYSYFRAGFENVTYDEKYPGISSSVTVTSPVINTGGLYYVNPIIDFSLDALATSSPGTAEEEWFSSGALIQRNRYQYLKVATQALLHVKLTPEWRILFGGAYSYQTHKRFGKESFQASTVPEVFSGTWEESSTDLFIDAGIGYDTGALHGPMQIQFRALVGMPIYGQTTNTADSLKDLTFSDDGYRMSIDGGISYTVYPGVSVGAFANLGYEKRNEAGPEYFMMEGEQYYAVLPEAETLSFQGGVQVLWSF